MNIYDKDGDLLKVISEPNRYMYLSAKDSRLYAKIKNSNDRKDKIIKKLLEEKAEDCLSSHCASRY